MTLPYPCVACASRRHDYCSGCTCADQGHDLTFDVLAASPVAPRPPDPDPEDPNGYTW
jgi:hypothetical protein